MKVNIFYVGDEQKEQADLHVKAGHHSLKELVSILERETYKEVILHVTDQDETYQINCKHVFFIESEREKLLVHTGKRKFFCRKKLYELETELPEYFVRISKSVILNTRQVHHYCPQLNGIMKAVLRNQEEVYISRKYLREIRTKIGGR